MIEVNTYNDIESFLNEFHNDKRCPEIARDRAGELLDKYYPKPKDAVEKLLDSLLAYCLGSSPYTLPEMKIFREMVKKSGIQTAMINKAIEKVGKMVGICTHEERLIIQMELKEIKERLEK